MSWPSEGTRAPVAARIWDLLVVGGGINGTAIARDAAGRGFSVLLCEQDDLAAHTSSASTKLIHGGLRYLEYGQFGLVRKALLEREVLLASAPHVLRPLHFVLPHAPHLRPAWAIRAGLFLYDHLARRRLLPGSRAIDLRTHPAGAPLAAPPGRGFVYSDVRADDSRLVVLNALDAADRGACILTRTRCERLMPATHGWTAELSERVSGHREIRARAVVNAAGPWVTRFLEHATPVRRHRTLRLVKGSHIIVPQLFQHRFAYILQNEDRRVVFAIPYEGAFTLIGTTDLEYQGEPAEARITGGETDYLCDTAQRWFARGPAAADVVASYSGVRPLIDDESAAASRVTRDYALEIDCMPAPVLSVFGGKLTTHRRLAEEAIDRLAALLGRRGAAWTRGAYLPGGNLPQGSFAVLLRTLERRYPWLPASLRLRFARSYGTRVDRILGDSRSLTALGAAVLPELHERELDYLCREEWARTPEDILWRRSKLGLHLPPGAPEVLGRWLERNHTGRAQAEIELGLSRARESSPLSAHPHRC